jgi:hypothetical protein
MSLVHLLNAYVSFTRDSTASYAYRAPLLDVNDSNTVGFRSGPTYGSAITFGDCGMMRIAPARPCAPLADAGALIPFIVGLAYPRRARRL